MVGFSTDRPSFALLVAAGGASIPPWHIVGPHGAPGALLRPPASPGPRAGITEQGPAEDKEVTM